MKEFINADKSLFKKGLSAFYYEKNEVVLRPYLA